MKKIKVIFIDAVNREIKEIEIENKLESYYRMIDCRSIAAPSFDQRHDVIVDDEGLLKNPTAFFEIEGEFACEYAGNGIIAAVNANGDWISHKLSLEEVKQKVFFITFIKFNGKIVKIRL